MNELNIPSDQSQSASACSRPCKPGEYMGADGDTRHWEQGQMGAWRLIRKGSSAGIFTADLRAAAASLIALADDLETEYVSLGEDWGRYRLVIRGDDVGLEERKCAGSNEWLTIPVPGICIPAFRAGLKRGRE
jgi:hypothetical protein